MTVEKQPAKKKPLGQPINWTEEDLGALADISPADLKAAEALWQREAPGPVKELLQAQVIKPDETNE